MMNTLVRLLKDGLYEDPPGITVTVTHDSRLAALKAVVMVLDEILVHAEGRDQRYHVGAALSNAKQAHGFMELDKPGSKET